MNDTGNHIKSRIESISVLVRQIAQSEGLPYEIAQFAASAAFQLAQLEAHMKTLRDPSTLTNRRSDRGYIGVATLPHGQTVEIPNLGTNIPDSGMLSFNAAESVNPAPPIGTRK